MSKEEQDNIIKQAATKAVKELMDALIQTMRTDLSVAVNVQQDERTEISEEDARAEGVMFFDKKLVGGELRTFYKDYQHNDGFTYSSIESFKTLWTSINGSESWNNNPWVWVIMFKKL